MQLSNLIAKLTFLKSKSVRFLAAATLAGAALTAAVPAAQAQHFAVGVRIGGPRYFAPPPPVVVYGGPTVVYGGPAYAYGGRAYAYGYDHRFDNARFHHEPVRGFRR
jgi:hypothetical protein